jgi:hypothetical protein
MRAAPSIASMLNDFRSVSLSILILLFGSLLGCHGSEVDATACNPSCICDGMPGRGLDTGPCSSCNPYGEVFFEAQCPASVAFNGQCEYELSSSDPSALALELTAFSVRVPGGWIISPTNANLPERPVVITGRRINDDALSTFIFQVRDTCQ